MEIDAKKNNRNEFEFLSIENSNSFNVNRLQGVKNIGSTFLLNKSNNVLTKKNEVELKQYFSKNKEELISILKEILDINKNDFKEENIQLLKSLVPEELKRLLNKDENRYIITYEGDFNELPENPETGKIYGLIGNENEVTYYLYLNDKYVILLDKKYYDNSYYKKSDVNTKIIELTSQLNEILIKLESILNNNILKSDFNTMNEKLNLIQHDINELKAFLNV